MDSPKGIAWSPGHCLGDQKVLKVGKQLTVKGLFLPTYRQIKDGVEAEREPLRRIPSPHVLSSRFKEGLECKSRSMILSIQVPIG